MDSMVSSTELMKQAEHWGFFSMPQLNQTGELNDAYWFKRRNVSSSRKVIASSVDAKYFPSTPQRVMVSTTRETSWRALRSRSPLSREPWKYLDATMLVAICDQPFGTSTAFCSKIFSPFSSVMRASRISHSTAS